MVELHFPVFKGGWPEAPILTMDQYVSFVEFNWRYIVDRKAEQKLRREDIPKEQFRLK